MNKLELIETLKAEAGLTKNESPDIFSHPMHYGLILLFILNASIISFRGC